MHESLASRHLAFCHRDNRSTGHPHSWDLGSVSLANRQRPVSSPALVNLTTSSALERPVTTTPAPHPAAHRLFRARQSDGASEVDPYGLPLLLRSVLRRSTDRGPRTHTWLMVINGGASLGSGGPALWCCAIYSPTVAGSRLVLLLPIIGRTPTQPPMVLELLSDLGLGHVPASGLQTREVQWPRVNLLI